MKFVSWNVNGLRACVEKGFREIFDNFDADIFCLQETKLQQGQIDLAPEGYYAYWNYAEKKGYSGTAVFARQEPLSVHVWHRTLRSTTTEGRVITLEYPDFYFVCVYTPNAQRELTRLAYRMEWEDAFREYLLGLDAKKPVVVCGDMNVAHQEIDLKNPKTNVGNAGFTDEERGKFTQLLDAGFTDTFRALHPDQTGAVFLVVAICSRRAPRNTGWRIDYFLVSNRLFPRVTDAAIHADVMGSDHCPVSVTIE